MNTATLDTAIFALARRASETAILPRYRNLAAGEVFDKGGNDPVTVADREAEDILREGLAALDPSLACVGEEGSHGDAGELAGLAGDCWIVDPLDGTRNFAAGRGPFGILIARASGGLAQSGWIYDCLTGRCCAAHAGGGAWVDGARISARASGESPPVAAISLIFMDQAKRAAMQAHIAPHYRLADIPLCAAEQYPRLALGANDCAIFERTMAWDHAAGVLWLNEAGGMAARPDGTPYRVDGDTLGGLVGAASPALWEGLAGRLALLQ